MENKIIVAAHGTYALGVKSAVEIIAGPQKHIMYVSMYTDNTTDYEKEVEKILESVKDENVVVLTDLNGGSVNRLFLSQLGRYSFHLISGFNLGITLELLLKNELIETEYLRELLKDTCAGAVYCNDLMEALME